MTSVDAWADAPHYVAHLAPIWSALPAHLRGKFFVPHQLAAEALALGVKPVSVTGWRPPVARFRRDFAGPMMVASFAGTTAWAPSRRPIILLNHGAGQTYDVNHPSYSGGSRRKHVALYLEPGPHAAEATRAAYPDARVVEVGCAKLDRYHLTDPRRITVADRPVVAISTHWDCKVVPETRSVLREFADQLEALADGPWDLIAHAHPLARFAPAFFEARGIEFIANFDHVLDLADLYVCDNSSTLYEFASTGRPVLCLNGKGYRKDVHHGLRFWDAAPGLQCDHDQDLVAAVELALTDPPEARALRAHGVSRAYVACDGRAAQRAADAVAAFTTEVSPA